MEEKRAAGKLAKGAAGKAGPGRGKRGGKIPPRFDDPPTLADQGVDKDLAKEARWAAFTAGHRRVRRVISVLKEPTARRFFFPLPGPVPRITFRSNRPSTQREIAFH